MCIFNRKIVSLLALSLSLPLFGAEKLLDWNSARPDDYGKCRLSKKGALTMTKEGALFNGRDSFLHLGTPKIAESLTIAMQVKLDELPEKQYTFAVNGTSEDRTPDVYSFTIGYSGNYAGQTQELTYAAKVTEGGVNTYRNVLLEMRVPALQSLGTLVYKLTSAEFNSK